MASAVVVGRRWWSMEMVSVVGVEVWFWVMEGERERERGFGVWGSIGGGH